MNVARTATSAFADRIRIEDEVWDDAFASRVRSRPKRGAAPKTRPAATWFIDPDDQPRPYGVDPPAGLEAPLGIDPRDGFDVPFGVDPSSRGAAPSAFIRDVTPPLPARNPSEPTQLPANSDPPRRTIRIQGRGAERNLPVTRSQGHAPAATRRRTSLFDQRSGFEPDRVAMWAMLLGVALVAVAILSSSL